MKQAIKHLKLRLEIATFFFVSSSGTLHDICRFRSPFTTTELNFFTQNKIFNSSPIRIHLIYFTDAFLSLKLWKTNNFSDEEISIEVNMKK